MSDLFDKMAKPDHDLPKPIVPPKPELPHHETPVPRWPQHRPEDKPDIPVHPTQLPAEPKPPTSAPKVETLAELKIRVHKQRLETDAKNPTPDNPVLYKLGMDVEEARLERSPEDIPDHDLYWKAVEALRQYYSATKDVDKEAFVEEEAEPKTPVIESLVPDNAVIGDASFTLSVKGTGFDHGSLIKFAGQDEPTTYVSPTEVTTGINMDVWLGPDVLPVLVISREGVESNVKNFTFAATKSTTSGKGY